MTTRQIADIATSAATIVDALEPNYNRLNEAQGTLLRHARNAEKACQASLKGHNAQAWVVEATTAFEAALKEIN